MTTCKCCGAEIDELAVFPGGICVECHTKRFDAKLAKEGWEAVRPDFRKVFRKPRR